MNPATQKPVIRKVGLHKARCGEIVKILTVGTASSTGIAYVPVKRSIYRQEYRTWMNNGSAGSDEKHPWDVVGVL